MKISHITSAIFLSAVIAIPVFVSGQSATTTPAISTCPLIKTYMNLGRADNRPDEVAKLQSFLRNSQKLDVDVTGTFDQKTEAAVRAFQSTHADTVLAPWGGTKTSGYVYITTRKKINEIACNERMTLSSSDMEAIQAFRTKFNVDGQVAIVPTRTSVSVSSTVSPTASPSLVADMNEDENNENIENGENEDESESADESDQVAATGDSIASRFWSFVKGLFN